MHLLQVKAGGKVNARRCIMPVIGPHLPHYQPYVFGTLKSGEQSALSRYWPLNYLEA
jgi:hypothetical protein